MKRESEEYKYYSRLHPDTNNTAATMHISNNPPCISPGMISSVMYPNPLVILALGTGQDPLIELYN